MIKTVPKAIKYQCGFRGIFPSCSVGCALTKWFGLYLSPEYFLESASSGECLT